jgi:hypothetical protein
MEKLTMHTLLSVLTLTTGVVLMIYMMYEESEPGALPILLVIVGIGWYSIARIRIQSHHE